MRVTTSQRGGVSVLQVSGRLVLHGGEEALRVRLDELIRAGERFFVFDLDGLSYMDSAGVGEIVACYTHAQKCGAVVKVALRPGGVVRRIFEISGLERALEVFDRLDDAVASYG